MSTNAQQAQASPNTTQQGSCSFFTPAKSPAKSQSGSSRPSLSPCGRSPAYSSNASRYVAVAVKIHEVKRVGCLLSILSRLAAHITNHQQTL